MKNLFLKIAFRNIIKDKISSGFNILGFALTLTTILLISFYIINELSYDSFHMDSDRIFRATVKSVYQNGEIRETAGLIHMVGPEASKKIPSIMSYSRIYPEWKTLIIKSGLNIFSESEIAYVDKDFFSVFSFKFKEGNPEDFAFPRRVILNQRTAEKYFGNNGSAMNKVLIIDGAEYKVVGIIENIPLNSHFDFNLLISISTKDVGDNFFYQGGSFFTYLKIDNKTDSNVFLSQLNSLSKILYQAYDKRKNKEPRLIKMGIQPLRKIHLYSNFQRELKKNGNIFFIRLNIFLAILLISISTINYINTTTAISEKKSKSIGIQKVLGAKRNQLIYSLFIEILAPPIIAFVIAFFLAITFSKYFMPLLGLEISIATILSWKALLVFAFLGIIISFLATLYPVFYLSKLPILKIMSGYSLSGLHRNSILYKVLICFQFASSMFLIILLLQIAGQLDYLKNKDLGFDKDNVIVYTNIPYRAKKKLSLIKEELLKCNFINSITISKQIPGERMPETEFSFSQVPNSKWIECSLIRGDINYVPTLGMKLLKGRNFSDALSTDRNSIIINESAEKKLGTKDVLGKQVNLDGKIYSIIGVLKDFHVESLHKKIKPVLFILGKSGTTDLIINMNRNTYRKYSSTIETNIKKIAPEYIPDSYLLKDRFDRMYKPEEQTQKILIAFSYIAIIICIMGVWAFSSLFLQKKQKEIAIRKIHGANNYSLLGLLLMNFFPWILLAFIIAAPIAYMFSTNWLGEFAYKMSVSNMSFIITLISVCLVVLFAISYHYIKIIQIYPAAILRKE